MSTGVLCCSSTHTLLESGIVVASAWRNCVKQRVAIKRTAVCMVHSVIFTDGNAKRTQGRPLWLVWRVHDYQCTDYCDVSR